jgi:hypothetical protein
VTTYEDVHAGDTVLGHDNDVWGVEVIDHGPPLVVTLVKDEGRTRVTGRPPAGTPVTVVSRSDIRPEIAAAQVLVDAGFTLEILGERING